MTPMEMTLVVFTISLLLLQPHQTLGTFSSPLTTQLLFHFKVINSSVVQPELTITTMDTFSLEFRYGHATSGLILFTACIHHIPLPILNHARSISLARGGFAVVTTAHLLASDTRGKLNNSLYCNITGGPRHAVFFSIDFLMTATFPWRLSHKKM